MEKQLLRKIGDVCNVGIWTGMVILMSVFKGNVVYYCKNLIATVPF
jgi:hypothetical protein